MATSHRRSRQSAQLPLDSETPPVALTGGVQFGDAKSGDLSAHERLRRIANGDLRGIGLHGEYAPFLRGAFEAAAARGGGTIDLAGAHVGEDAIAQLDPWMVDRLRRLVATRPAADLTSAWKFVKKGLERGRLCRPATAALLAPLLPKHANELLCLAISQDGAETVDLLVATGINLARITAPTARHSPWCVNEAIERLIRGHRSTAILEALLRAGAPAEPPRAWTRGRPLLRALQIKDPDLAIAVIDLLVAAGADLGVRGNDGATPLHVAAHERVHPRIIHHLVDLGYDPNGTMNKNATPLFFAITGTTEKAEPAVLALLARGARADARNGFGSMIIHLYAGVARTPISLLDPLLAAGATVHDRNDAGQTPLHVAIEHRHRTLVPRLLDLGADPLAVDADGRTTLMRWILTHPYDQADMDIGRALHAAGVPLDARDARGWTALAHAVHGHQEKNVDLLLGLGADPDLPAADGTPVEDLCGTRYPELAAAIRRRILAARASRTARAA